MTSQMPVALRREYCGWGPLKTFPCSLFLPSEDFQFGPWQLVAFDNRAQVSFLEALCSLLWTLFQNASNRNFVSSENPIECIQRFDFRPESRPFRIDLRRGLWPGNNKDRFGWSYSVDLSVFSVHAIIVSITVGGGTTAWANWALVRANGPRINIHICRKILLYIRFEKKSSNTKTKKMRDKWDAILY